MESLSSKILTPELLERLKREQKRCSKKIIKSDEPPVEHSIVTGVDVAYRGDRAYAVAVTFDYDESKVLSIKNGIYTVKLPYLTGLFQIREGPILIDLLKDFENTGPILIDANGLLHPRRFGLASFVGLELNKQTIGVAKKLLIGEIGERQGDTAPIYVDNEILGKALWLESTQKPIYVSIGHRLTLDTAVGIVRACAMDGKPFPLHQAHLLSKGLF